MTRSRCSLASSWLKCSMDEASIRAEAVQAEKSSAWLWKSVEVRTGKSVGMEPMNEPGVPILGEGWGWKGSCRLVDNMEEAGW